MADGSVPLVLSPEPFSREVAYLEQPAGRTIKAALLDALKSGAIDADDLSRTVVYVDGHRLERDQTLDRVLVEGQIINVVVEPMGGGGRKDIGQILMTIAVIAVSMWIGGGGTALGTTLLARVAAAAVLTLGQAAVAAIFAPETENQAKVNERYALQTASNQYRPWAPMPLALGEVVVAPDFAAKTYTQSVGDDVWLHGILGLHYGPCTVADLKIGDTLASSMGPGDFRMVQHLTPGPREFTIYQNDPDQLDLQEELEATTGSATPIVRAGSAAGERFDFDFFLPGGLHFQKDDGRVLTASVTVYIRYRPVDEDGNPTGGGTWSTAPAASRSSTTKEPMRFTHSVSLPMGRYEFEFVRSLKPDNNEKRRDRIALTAIRSVAFRKAVTDETLSIIEFAVRATALNQGTLAPITCRIIPVCETWTGTTWGSPAPTSNPAALMRWLMTGPAPALPLQPSQADARLRAWSELCDEYDWRAGIYLLEERRQDQVIALLEQAGRASLFWDGRQLAAVCWVEKPAPVQLFANSNLRDHRWTIVYPDPVHAFRVEFQNIEEGGDPDELYVYADGYAETAGPGVEAAVLVEALRLEGQKTPERAYRDGRWELGARLHRRRIDTWTLDAEHLVSGYGARVRLAWQRVDGGTSSRIRCRRWSGGLVSGVRLAHPVEMRPGESYAVDIRLTSGVATSVPVINEADDAPVVVRELQFAVPRAPEFSPKRDDLIAFGVPTRISEDTEIIGVEPGEGLTAVLTGVRYVAPLLMAGETGPIPPLQTRLNRQRQASPPPPRFLGVQADPEGVRVSFDMPPWSGSPIVGFSARWRPTPAPGTETSWQGLPPVAAGDRMVMIPSPRAVPVSADDFEGRTLIDVEIRAVTEAGQTSPEPMVLDAVEVRKDPFPPDNLIVTPATRTGPQGSSHGVLVVSVTALEAAVGVDLILEVQRTPTSGAPDPWESAGLILAAKNPVGDITGLRSGERYRVRAGWRSGDGWPSAWTTSALHTVPAGSNVSDDTKNVGDVPAEDVAAAASQVPTLSALLQDAQDAIAQHEATLNTATSGLVDKTEAILATLNTPTTGVVARVTATETQINTPTTGLAARLTATEAAINTPTTGLLAVNAQQQQSIVDLANGKAEASRVALVEARALAVEVNVAGLSNPNADFSAWPVGQSLPTQWGSSYSVGITAAQVPGVGGYGFGLDVIVPPFGQHEIAQTNFTPRAIRPGWFAYDVEAELISGSWEGGGARLFTYDASGALLEQGYLQFALDPDVNGNVLGNSPASGRYTWRRLTQFANPATDRWYFGVSAGGLFTSSKAATGRVVLRRAGFRQATDAEVEQRNARGAFVSLQARHAASETAITNLAIGKAESTRVALVEARVDASEVTGLFPNDQFANWPGTVSDAPVSWGKGESGQSGIGRVAGISGRPYAAHIFNQLATDGVTLVTPYTAGKAGYYVLEAEWTLNSGSNDGAGLVCRGDWSGGYVNEGYMYLNGSAGRDNVTADGAASPSPASDGQAPGAGVPGTTYRMSKLIRLRDAAQTISQVRLLAYGNGINGYSGGGGAAAKSITLHRARMRVATAAEIEQREARGGFISLLARYQAVEQSTVDLANGKASVLRVEALEVRAGGANLLRASQAFTTTLSDVWAESGGGMGGPFFFDTDARYKPAGENYLYVGRSGGGYRQFIADNGVGTEIIAGKRYCCSLFVAGDYGQVLGLWRDGAGNYLGEMDGNANAGSGAYVGPSNTLASYKRVWCFGVAPAGAARLFLYYLARGDLTPPGNPGFYAAIRPMISEATATQTEAPPWAPPSLEGRVIETRSAIASLEGRVESRALLQVVAGNQVAGMQALAVSGPDASYSAINFWAGSVQISNNGSAAIAPFEVRDNVVRMREAVIDRVSVGTEILVGSRRLRLAVQPFAVSVTDGVPVSYGYPIGLAPEIVFLRDGPVSQPGTGESNNYYAEASTGTGFTPRLKITSAGVPTNQAQGPGGSTNDGTRLYFTLAGAAANNSVNVRVTGVVQSVFTNDAYNPGGPIQDTYGSTSQDGDMLLRIWTYAGGVWSPRDAIYVSPPFRGSQDAPGTYNDAFDITQTQAVDPAVTRVGISVEYETYSPSYLTDLRLAYQTASSSGTRSATPNGEMTTAMIYPRNGV